MKRYVVRGGQFESGPSRTLVHCGVSTGCGPQVTCSFCLPSGGGGRRPERGCSSGCGVWEVGCRKRAGRDLAPDVWLMQRPKPPPRPSPKRRGTLSNTNCKLRALCQPQTASHKLQATIHRLHAALSRFPERGRLVRPRSGAHAGRGAGIRLPQAR